MKSILILGCGYVGLRAARLFHRAGWRVTGVTRSPASAAALAAEPFPVLPCDISTPGALAAISELHHPSALISAVSSGRGGEDTYRAVYLHGLANAIAELRPARLLFTSSTSVYAQTDGSLVTEHSPADPASPTSRILRETEDLALRHAGLVARLAGIYGPGRSILLRKFLDHTARIEAGGARHINQIHADDAASALFHLIATGAPPGIYNVSDDTPITQLALYQWLSTHLHQPLSPPGNPDPARKRGVTDKRVSNARLKSLGWTPAYPSFQQALIHDPLLLQAARADGTGDAPP